MGKIIAIAALRGGVGKTTATWKLAYALSELGKKVLTVDFDHQLNLTSLYEKEEIDMFAHVSSSAYLDEVQEVWRDKYDYILLDTEPSMNELTVKALELADKVIVPVVDKFEEIMGLQELKQIIAKVKNTDLENVCVLEAKLSWVKDVANDEHIVEVYRELAKELVG